MALMGYRQYAAHRKAHGLKGGTLRAVQKALAAGRILQNSEKRIDSADADARWAATTDQALQRGSSAAPTGAAPAVTTPPKTLPLLEGVVENAPSTLSRHSDDWLAAFPDPLPPPVPLAERLARAALDNVVDGDSFMVWKTREQRANALAAERALAKEDGELLAADEVQKAFAAMGRMHAQGRESVATSLAPNLLGLTDLGEIERRIRAALRDVDQRIATEIRSQYAEVVDGRPSVAC